MTFSQKYADIRAEFISGNMTIRDLADKRGFGYDALRKVAARQEWMKERHKVSQKVTSDAVNVSIHTRVSELSQFNTDDLRMAKAIRGMAAKIINESQHQGGKKTKHWGTWADSTNCKRRSKNWPISSWSID